jgi:hypothetical protein
MLYPWSTADRVELDPLAKEKKANSADRCLAEARIGAR